MGSSVAIHRPYGDAFVMQMDELNLQCDLRRPTLFKVPNSVYTFMLFMTCIGMSFGQVVHIFFPPGSFDMAFRKQGHGQ